jgi:putative addiction module component (TIGR02574 family)
MTKTARRLKAELAKLSSKERAEIAHYLIRTLDEGADADADEAWEAEIKRRVAEIESGAVKGIPAEKVFAELRKKYP